MPAGKTGQKTFVYGIQRIDKLTEYAATEKFVSEAQNTSFVSLDNVQHETHNDTSRQRIYKLIVSFIKERSQ